MAYNKKNHLRRIIDIQNIYKKHSKHHQGGASDRWIFKNLIAPIYHISQATFYNYLAVPAQRELNEIIEQDEKGN